MRYKNYLKGQLKNETFKKEFDEEDVYVSVAIQIAKLREKEKLSQKDLARKLHTTQQTVSRLENVHNKSFSLHTLIRLATVLNRKLQVRFL